MIETGRARHHDFVMVLQNTHPTLPQPQPPDEAGRVAGLISHELRLPLTAILAYAELLAEDGLNPTRRADLHQEIRLAANQMNNLIRSLMELSRGRDNLLCAAGDIVDTLRRAIRMVAVRPEFRHLTVTYAHYGLKQGWFDSNQIKQAVANLVLNACEAVSPHSGRVEVVTVADRHTIEIEIWDNGLGVPDPVRESVFQPFVTYGKESGSGLGLAIVRKIIEDHGGEVFLARTGKDGTLFKIILPSVFPQATQPNADAPRHRGSISPASSAPVARVGAKTTRARLRKAAASSPPEALAAQLAVASDSSVPYVAAKIHA